MVVSCALVDGQMEGGEAHHGCGCVKMFSISTQATVWIKGCILRIRQYVQKCGVGKQQDGDAFPMELAGSSGTRRRASSNRVHAG